MAHRVYAETMTRARISPIFHTQSSASSAMWMINPSANSRVTRGTSSTTYAAIAG